MTSEHLKKVLLAAHTPLRFHVVSLRDVKGGEAVIRHLLSPAAKTQIANGWGYEIVGPDSMDLAYAFARGLVTTGEHVLCVWLVDLVELLDEGGPLLDQAR